MIKKFKGKKPKISDKAIVDETAIIIGNVEIEDYASVWPGAIIRGDEKIVIERGAVILDKAFIESPCRVVIGKGSVVSHGAIVHGSKIGENVLVGIGAIVLEVSIGKNCVIGAGTVVTKDFEENSFIVGIPAKKIRKVSEEEIERTRDIAREMIEKAKEL